MAECHKGPVGACVCVRARTLCVYTIGYPQLRGQVYEFMYTVAYGDIWLPRPMYIARETGFLNHV